jgi:hypothetical protein
MTGLPDLPPGSIIYSAALDGDTCPACEAADGSTGTTDTITPVPNPECTSKEGCRCIQIAVLDPSVDLR